MASVILDTSAIIALLNDEPGADLVDAHMSDARISAINFQEVITILLRQGIPMDAALDLLDTLRLDIMPHGHKDATTAAALYPATRIYGSGLGDRSCMALGIALSLPVLTADQAWARLDIAGLEVMLIR